MYTFHCETITESVKRVLIQLDRRFTPTLLPRSFAPIPIPQFLSSVIQGRKLAIFGSQKGIDDLVLNLLARLNRLPVEALKTGSFDQDWWPPLCNSVEIIKAAMPTTMVVVSPGRGELPELDVAVEGIIIEAEMKSQKIERQVLDHYPYPAVIRSFLPRVTDKRWASGRVNLG
jgi:hypothetical protein